MPFKSKAQQRFMFASEAEGELPKGTAKRWANETEKKKGGIEALPEKVGKRPMKKSAAEIAEKVCTPEEKAKCCEGEGDKKEEKKDEKKEEKKEEKSEGNPFAKKDEGNPFAKKEAAYSIFSPGFSRIGALSSFVKNAANPFYDDGRQSERLDPKTVGLLSALPIDVLGPIASGLGAPKGRGAAAVGGNIVGQLGGAALGAGAGVGLGSLGALLGMKDPELLMGILGGAGLLAGKGIGGGYGYHLATKDAVRKEAACASNPSSSKPKKMKKSPKEIANKVWTSKKNEKFN